MSMPHGTTSTNDQNERWIKMIPDRVDWTVAAYNGAHIWQETDASGCFSPDCKVCAVSYTHLTLPTILLV